jgi:ATP-dependent Clp protease adapter protein ClpS
MGSTQIHRSQPLRADQAGRRARPPSPGNDTTCPVDTSVVAKTADWLVEMRNDDVNTFFSVAYLLHRLCGMSLTDASRTMIRVHERRRAEIGRFTSQDEAEELAARLQTFGLHAMVRGPR